ncbi:MAG: YeaH/YhbH family protein [bacterium]
MAIKEQDWTLSQRGLKDAARHREKIKESIRENIADIISDEAIITKKRGKIIKVPVRGIKSYRFIYGGERNNAAGIGQGKGKKGDIIGRQQKKGKPGEAGDQPGIDYLETEIDIDELIEMMMEDLGLPNLRKKEVAQIVIPKGWTFENIEKVGLKPHLDKKRTIKEAIKRTESFIFKLQSETGAREDECRKALYDARGDYAKAKEIIEQMQQKKEEGRSDDTSFSKRSPFIFNDDLRYRVLKEDVEYRSNAVVLAMMDISGSMGIMKKYIARSFFFWMVEFLKHLYKKVDIRFIAHTTEAKLVDEHEFFYKGESGGTFCSSAYELAIDLVDAEYQPSMWNIYPFHFSDGEDWDTSKTVLLAKKLMLKGINMLGYGEIQVDSYTSAQLMNAFIGGVPLERIYVPGLSNFDAWQSKNREYPFLGVIIKEKSHVYPAIKELLRKERSFK